MSLPGDSGPKYRDYIEAARARGPSREGLLAIARRVEEQVKAPAESAQAASSTRPLHVSAAILGGVLVVALVVVFAPREESPTQLPEIPSPPNSTEPTEPPSLEPEGAPLERGASPSEPEPSDRIAPSQEPEERSVRPRPHRNTSRSPEEEELRGTNEIELIEAAEAALATRPQRALEFVTAHERTFSRGAFVEEREVIAVDALSRIGRTEAAHARAERFRRQHPESAYTRRLDRIIARMSSGGVP